MPYDYKKECKELYQPPKKPALVNVPAMNYVAVRGKGDPNEPDGDYQHAMELLYGISFTIKMAPKAGVDLDGYFSYVVPPLEGFWSLEGDGGFDPARKSEFGISFTIKMAPKAGVDLDGYFSYVVPPLEGFWSLEGDGGFDPARKSEFSWISCIRLPEFVTPETFAWAKGEAERKKRRDFSRAEFLTVDEGLCVQCMHVGSYDDEPPTIETMRVFAEENGYSFDLRTERLHHEIYLSDPRRTAVEKLKTVIRIPIC